MPTTWNPTDVAPVAADELRAQMRLAEADRGGLAISRTLSEFEIGAMECAFWQTYCGPAEHGQAIFARFICLQPILAARRLQDLLEANRDEVIDAACAIAGSMPLNMFWGFNRHKLINAIRLNIAETTLLPDEEVFAAAA